MCPCNWKVVTNLDVQQDCKLRVGSYKMYLFSMPIGEFCPNIFCHIYFKNIPWYPSFISFLLLFCWNVSWMYLKFEESLLGITDMNNFDRRLWLGMDYGSDHQLRAECNPTPHPFSFFSLFCFICFVIHVDSIFILCYPSNLVLTSKYESQVSNHQYDGAWP